MAKILTSFNLDFSDLPAATTNRQFTITGDIDAEFYLEITNAAGNYYNFTTNLFQVAKTSLDDKINKSTYKGNITFPTVTSATQYNINFWAKVGTEHADYIEARFADNSVDINSSTGSNSLLIQKVIYQYVDLTLTLSTYSPNSIANIIKSSSKVDSEIKVSRFKSAATQAFTISCEVDNAAQSYQIRKQPTADDILTFNQLTIGSAAELLPGEDEYPDISNTDTVDGDFTAGSTKIVMDTDVADKITVGDKITASTATNIVAGATSDSNRIVFDNVASTKCAVGDILTFPAGGSTEDEALDKTLSKFHIFVTHLDPDGDNAREIQVNQAISCADDAVITFNPIINAALTTVAALDPDGDNTKEFSLSTSRNLVDGTTLSFSNRKNYQWPVDDIKSVLEDMQVFPSGNILTETEIANYEDTVTLNEGTRKESIIIVNSAPFKTTKNQTPTITNGVLTTQAGNIVFNKQQPLSLASDVIYVGGYGTKKILEAKDYDIKFTNLKIELDTITTTTTAAVVNSTTIPVASVNGILPGVSTVSGIGINASVADPTVNSRNVTSGAGDLILSAPQNLESGVTLTFANAGQKATITGDVEILRAGYRASPFVRFDVEKLLSIT